MTPRRARGHIGGGRAGVMTRKRGEEEEEEEKQRQHLGREIWPQKASPAAGFKRASAASSELESSTQALAASDRVSLPAMSEGRL